LMGWMVLALIGSIGVLTPWVPYVGLAGLYVNGYAAQLFLFDAWSVLIARVWTGRRRPSGSARTAARECAATTPGYKRGG
jgi:hypothetical protein